MYLSTEGADQLEPYVCSSLDGETKIMCNNKVYDLIGQEDRVTGLIELRTKMNNKSIMSISCPGKICIWEYNQDIEVSQETVSEFVDSNAKSTNEEVKIEPKISLYPPLSKTLNLETIGLQKRIQETRALQQSYVNNNIIFIGTGKYINMYDINYLEDIPIGSIRYRDLVADIHSCDVLNPHLLIAGYRNGVSIIWDMRAPGPVMANKSTMAISRVYFKNNMMLIGGYDSQVHFIDIRNGKEMCSIMNHIGSITNIIYSDNILLTSCQRHVALHKWNDKRLPPYTSCVFVRSDILPMFSGVSMMKNSKKFKLLISSMDKTIQEYNVNELSEK